MGDKTAIAHHEAGHAIVAHVLGLRVGSMTLRGEGDDWHGVTQIEPDETERRIVELYGGVEAHLRYCPHDEVEAAGGAEDDFETIDSLAVALASEPDRLKLELRGKAKAHVEERWEAISALARELLQHKRLSPLTTPRLDVLLFELTRIPWR